MLAFQRLIVIGRGRIADGDARLRRLASVPRDGMKLQDAAQGGTGWDGNGNVRLGRTDPVQVGTGRISAEETPL